MNNYDLLSNCETDMIGRFIIYIDKSKTIIYKKTKKRKLGSSLRKNLKKKNNFLQYKKILSNIKNDPIIGNYTINVYDIETDGSYKSKFIKGYRLDKIFKKDIVINDINIKSRIKIEIKNLQKILNKNHENISGDWALHNLIYSIDDNIIYNIDIEGFYTHLKLPTWGNIKEINNWFNDLINIL